MPLGDEQAIEGWHVHQFEAICVLSFGCTSFAGCISGSQDLWRCCARALAGRPSSTAAGVGPYFVQGQINGQMSDGRRPILCRDSQVVTAMAPQWEEEHHKWLQGFRADPRKQYPPQFTGVNRSSAMVIHIALDEQDR